MTEVIRDHFTPSMIGKVVEVVVYENETFTCAACGVLEMWAENAHTGLTAVKFVGGIENKVKWETDENTYTVTYDPERK